MKRIYFLGLMGVSVICANAQNIQNQNVGKAMTSLKPQQRSVDVPVHSPVKVNNTIHRQQTEKFGKAGGSAENILTGTTFIVNQTNNSIYRRVEAYPDGKISFTWMTATDNGANNYYTRGSGYNYFNGTSWMNSGSSANGLRIEPNRAGYPCFVTSPDNKEIIVSHNVDTANNSGGLIINKNNGIGNSTWASSTFLTKPNGTPTPLWPRAVVTGHYMIVIAEYQDSTQKQPNYVTKAGVRSPLVWSRYDFNTSNWDVQDQTLPGYDSSITIYNTANDNYSIDASGNDVAILVGGVFNSLVLWKSGDNGTNWTRTIVDEFPVPGYRFDKDTLMPAIAVNNGSVHVMVDNNGKAHVFTGLAQVSDSILGDGQYTYSYSRAVDGVNDGILYWNEYNGGAINKIFGTPAAADGTTDIVDQSFTDDDRSYGISNATWPSAGIDANGNIYVVFSGLTPGDVFASANCRDIYAAYTTDLGENWSTPVNITNGNDWLGTTREEIFPNMAKNITGDKLHITYLNKDLPGLKVAEDNDEAFRMYYLGMPTDQIINGTVGINETAKNELFSIDQNFPNPFSSTTSIPVNFKRSTSVKVNIIDVMGKTVYSNTFANVPTGKSTLDVNLGKVPSGVYFYTVEADGFKTTRRMSVNN